MGPTGHSGSADGAPFAGYVAARAQALGSDLPFAFICERSAVQTDLVSCQSRSHQAQLAARKATPQQQELDRQKHAADVAQHVLDVKVRETEARLAAREAVLLQRQIDRQNVEEVHSSRPTQLPQDFQQALPCERDTLTDHGARTEAVRTLRALRAPPSSSDDVAALSSEAWESSLINWAVEQYGESGSLPVVGPPSSLVPEQTRSAAQPAFSPSSTSPAAIQPHRAFTIEDIQTLERGLELHWSQKGAAQLDAIKQQLGLTIISRNIAGNYLG